MDKRLLALVLLAACGRPTNPITAPGTVLVEWDSAKATRADFAKATVGAKSSKDSTATISHDGAPTFQLTLHVETAPVDLVESGKPVHQLAPVAIKITVKQNDGWDLSAKCQDGPNYEMPSLAPDGHFVTALGMVEDCTVHERRKAGPTSFDLATTFTVKGDGTLEPYKPFPGEGVKID